VLLNKEADRTLSFPHSLVLQETYGNNRTF